VLPTIVLAQQTQNAQGRTRGDTTTSRTTDSARTGSRADSARTGSRRVDSARTGVRNTDSVRTGSQPGGMSRMGTDSSRMRMDASPMGTTRRSGAANQPPVTSERRIRVQKRDGMSGGTDGTGSMTQGRTQGSGMDTTARVTTPPTETAEAQRERARLDSIAAMERARADSVMRVERQRSDSIARAERQRADSVVAVENRRRDSVAAAAAESARRAGMYSFNRTGWYIGVAGGGAIPTGDFETLGYGNGLDIVVPIGWRGSFGGVRLDLGYNQLQGRTFLAVRNEVGAVTLNNRDPKIWSAALNLTGRIPLNARRTIGLYALGGGGFYHFRQLEANSALNGFLGQDIFSDNVNERRTNRTRWGVQGGAGLDVGIGPASLFVESRFVNVFANPDASIRQGGNFGTNGRRNLQWVPITLGVYLR
jgi:hypothetical protein